MRLHYTMRHRLVVSWAWRFVFMLSLVDAHHLSPRVCLARSHVMLHLPSSLHGGTSQRTLRPLHHGTFVVHHQLCHTHTAAHGLVKLPIRISPTFARGRSRDAKLMWLSLARCMPFGMWGRRRPSFYWLHATNTPCFVCASLSFVVCITDGGACALWNLDLATQFTIGYVFSHGLHHPCTCTRLSQAPYPNLPNIRERQVP